MSYADDLVQAEAHVVATRAGWKEANQLYSSAPDRNERIGHAWEAHVNTVMDATGEVVL